MSKTLLGRLLVASAAFALASCGGGGDGVDSTPPPPTTKTCPDGSVVPITSNCPEPPPPPPLLSDIFPGITTNTEFAVLGLEAGDQNIPVTALARDGFAVRYDAASDSYIFDLPSTVPAGLRVTSEEAAFWHGFVDGQDPLFAVLKPSPSNPEIALAYTSLGIASGYYTTPFGFVAFGIPTPSSGVPLSGTASYEAYVRGRTLTDFGIISGDATLQFDFGTGALSGHFDPVLELNGVVTDLGSYNFVNTVFGAGSTTFSGGLSHAGAPRLGAFDGRFTGPQAQELMSRWTAPYLNPGTQQWLDMFGVWVGKRP